MNFKTPPKFERPPIYVRGLKGERYIKASELLDSVSGQNALRRGIEFCKRMKENDKKKEMDLTSKIEDLIFEMRDSLEVVQVFIRNQCSKCVGYNDIITEHSKECKAITHSLNKYHNLLNT